MPAIYRHTLMYSALELPPELRARLDQEAGHEPHDQNQLICIVSATNPDAQAVRAQVLATLTQAWAGNETQAGVNGQEGSAQHG